MVEVSFIEIAIDLFQSLVFVGFLYFFFDKPDNKKLNIVCYAVFSLALFGVLIYSSYCEEYQLQNDLLLLLELELYSLLCLKGNIFSRIVMPIASFMINSIVCFVFTSLVSSFSENTYDELISEATIYRYICIALVNITDIAVFAILIKFRNHNVKLKKITDVIIFIILPVAMLFAIYATFHSLLLTKNESEIIIYLAVIGFCMIAITAIVWYAVWRISKENEIKTKLLLMEQRTSLYQSNILQNNVQIEKILRVKHDMKNNLLCIDNLISNQEYEEAQTICREVSDNLKAIYTPISTDNPLLNAVINVEQEKASALNIAFTIEIADEMTEFSENSDIISIIGNMCDNAIEYLKNCNEKNRQMKLKIYSHGNHYIINCGNRIEKSVLEENPKLLTSKDDSKNHGKGTEILKAAADKYDGEIRFLEEDEYFYCAMILKKQSLPENN
ncbi:MAG: sensor histidine kinase [Ruminococcus sp.]